MTNTLANSAVLLITTTKSYIEQIPEQVTKTVLVAASTNVLKLVYTCDVEVRFDSVFVTVSQIYPSLKFVSETEFALVELITGFHKPLGSFLEKKHQADIVVTSYFAMFLITTTKGYIEQTPSR
jgi:hypothetical protein